MEDQKNQDKQLLSLIYVLPGVMKTSDADGDNNDEMSYKHSPPNII